MSRPCVLSVAGFDPGGGAGLLADVKSFEQHGVHGFGVCTAVTAQHDGAVRHLRWLTAEEILVQISTLAERYPLAAVKIGLISDLTVLGQILDRLDRWNAAAPVVWDPILAASAGFPFHDGWRSEELLGISSRVTLVTPNRVEMATLLRPLGVEDGAGELSARCAVFLKGGHGEGSESVDLLLQQGRQVMALRAPRVEGEPKRGTGCVLSASIAACLARGLDLIAAVTEAHGYVQRFIRSTPGVFGAHTTGFSLSPARPLGRAEVGLFGSRYGAG